MQLGVEVTVPCPHCIAANLPNPTTFSFTELQRALLQPENAYIMCKNVGKFGSCSVPSFLISSVYSTMLILTIECTTPTVNRLCADDSNRPADARRGDAAPR
jgi:hypothetical protein